MGWGPAALWAAVLFLLSEIQTLPRPELLAVNDKMVHVVLYGILGAALAWGKHHAGRGIAHWAALMAGFAYGAVDEWHQRFVPRRDPSMADFGADVAGVTLGYVLLLFLVARYGRSRSDEPAAGSRGSSSSA